MATKTSTTTTSLAITVNGAPPSSPIQVSLIQNGIHIADFSTFKNITHPFLNLAPGNYDMLINGVNAHGSAATFTLSTTHITLHPPDNSPITRIEPRYQVAFHFTVPAAS